MPNGPGATVRRARQLRRALTLPEGLLWRTLRRRPGGLKFRRQHPAGPYVIDFYCAEARLAVEVDGASHAMGERPGIDVRRDHWLAEQGVATLRIAAVDILVDLDAVLRLIVAKAGERRPLHRPTDGPPPRFGEE